MTKRIRECYIGVVFKLLRIYYNHTVVAEIQTIQDKYNEVIGSDYLEEILDSYSPIIEKIVTEQEEIPFETVTKDVSNGSTVVVAK